VSGWIWRKQVSSFIDITSYDKDIRSTTHRGDFKVVDLGSGRGATVLGLSLLLSDFTDRQGLIIGFERDFLLYQTSLELKNALNQKILPETAGRVKVKLLVFIPCYES
jgi:hypothetical protein